MEREVGLGRIDPAKVAFAAGIAHLDGVVVPVSDWTLVSAVPCDDEDGNAAELFPISAAVSADNRTPWLHLWVDDATDSGGYMLLRRGHIADSHVWGEVSDHDASTCADTGDAELLALSLGQPHQEVALRALLRRDPPPASALAELLELLGAPRVAAELLHGTADPQALPDARRPEPVSISDAIRHGGPGEPAWIRHLDWQSRRRPEGAARRRVQRSPQVPRGRAASGRSPRDTRTAVDDPPTQPRPGDSIVRGRPPLHPWVQLDRSEPSRRALVAAERI